MKFVPICITLLVLLSCGNSPKKERTEAQQKLFEKDPVLVQMQDGLKKAYFASGCFWCVGVIYEHVAGVKEVIYGYSGGHTKNPTYESSNTGNTGHAESV